MGREMTTFRWKKSPQYLNNSTQFRWKMEIHRLDSLPSPVYSKSSTCSILVDRKKSTRWKSMVQTRLQRSQFGWIEKSTRWKRSMVRIRLQLSLFGWIEKSTRGKKKSMVRTRLRLSLFWWIEKSTRWKKVWAEPDFDSAYFGGSKKEKHVTKQVGILQNVKFWYSTELVSSGKNYLNL